MACARAYRICERTVDWVVVTAHHRWYACLGVGMALYLFIYTYILVDGMCALRRCAHLHQLNLCTVDVHFINQWNFALAFYKCLLCTDVARHNRRSHARVPAIKTGHWRTQKRNIRISERLNEISLAKGKWNHLRTKPRLLRRFHYYYFYDVFFLSIFVLGCFRSVFRWQNIKVDVDGTERVPFEKWRKRKFAEKSH